MLLALGIAAVAPTRAGAELITYTETAVVSGTLGSTGFTNALLTITATADTSQVTGGGGFFTVPLLSNSFTIAGTGGGTVTDSDFYVFVNQTFVPPAVGFAKGLGSLLATFNQTFATYDLKTSLAPTTGGAFVNSSVTFGTSAGNLNLTGFSGDATFRATLVPEPASIAMVGIGLAGIGLIARRARGCRAA